MEAITFHIIPNSTHINCHPYIEGHRANIDFYRILLRFNANLFKRILFNRMQTKLTTQINFVQFPFGPMPFRTINLDIQSRAIHLARIDQSLILFLRLPGFPSSDKRKLSDTQGKNPNALFNGGLKTDERMVKRENNNKKKMRKFSSRKWSFCCHFVLNVYSYQMCMCHRDISGDNFIQLFTLSIRPLPLVQFVVSENANIYLQTHTHTHAHRQSFPA